MAGLAAFGQRVDVLERQPLHDGVAELQVQLAGQATDVRQPHDQAQALRALLLPGQRLSVQLAVDAELRQFALNSQMAVQTAAGVGQPVAERGDRQLQFGVVAGAGARGQLQRAGAGGEFETAVQHLLRRQVQLAVAADRALAQVAGELADLQRGVEAAGHALPSAGDVGIQRALPVRQQLAGVERRGADFGLPRQRRLQDQLTAGLKLALGLFQFERAHLQALRRAVQLQRQLRRLAGRTQLQIALHPVRVDAAAGLELTAAGQHLADQLGRQLQVAPADLQVGGERPGVELHGAARFHVAPELGRAEPQLFERQRVVTGVEPRA